MITSIFSYLFAILEGVNRCPPSIQRAAAQVFTRVCFAVLPGVQRTMAANLERVLPGTSRRERLRIARRIVIGYGQYFIDYFGVFMTPGRKKASDYFSEVVGREHVAEALDRDSGALLVTAHLGNWELGLLVLEPYYPRLAVLTAPVASANMRRKLAEFRARLGIELVTLDNPAEYMFVLKRLLMEKKIVTLLADRYIGGASDRALFFGADARFPTGYLHLARMFDAPVLPCFIVRNRDRKYSCFAEAPIWVSHEGNRDEDVRRALGQVAGVFERYIREYVLQWYRYTPVWGE